MRCTAVICLFLAGSGLVAQSYIPFLDTTATWQDQYVSGDPGPGTSDTECYLYYLGGDTLVNDTTYRILRKTGRHDHAHIEPSYSSHTYWFSGVAIGMVREDTLTRRVFYRDMTWPPFELLMYDFAAAIGPYPWTYAIPAMGMEVTAVDTVELIDGPHRRMTINAALKIIEGIGRIDRFMPTQVPAPYILGGLVCHTTSGVQHDFGPENGCICGSNVSIPAHQVNRLRINPSPTTDLCRLEGASGSVPFRILALDGRIVRSGTCSDSGSAIVHLADLNAGMYLVQVLETNGALQVKVIKE